MDCNCLFEICEKCLNTEFFSGPYFPEFENTGKYKRIQIREKSVFRHFSCNIKLYRNFEAEVPM